MLTEMEENKNIAIVGLLEYLFAVAEIRKYKRVSKQQRKEFLKKLLKPLI